MSIELKPCPFCGREAVLSSIHIGDGDYRALVTCTRIGLSDGCASVMVERSSKRTAELDAAKKWNTRAERTCVVEEVVKRERALGAPTWDYQFSCGHFAYEWPWKKAPAYCPDCGAKVVDE